MLNRFYLYLLILLAAVPVAGALAGVAWNGRLSDSTGKPLAGAVIRLQSAAHEHEYRATTGADGKFVFAELPPERYQLSVTIAGKQWTAEVPLVITNENSATSLQLTA